MKSQRDEIRTDVRDTEDGFDFIVSEANDFIRALRGFHRGTAAISLKQGDSSMDTKGREKQGVNHAILRFFKVYN